MPTVNVRALPRQGFNGFHRGGHFWPSDDGITVNVSLELLEVLEAEKHLAVERPKGESGEFRDLIDNRIDDRAHNASAGLREENAEMEKRLAVRDAERRNAELRAMLDASEDERAIQAENLRLKHEVEMREARAENERLRAALEAAREPAANDPPDGKKGSKDRPAKGDPPKNDGPPAAA